MILLLYFFETRYQLDQHPSYNSLSRWLFFEYRHNRLLELFSFLFADPVSNTLGVPIYKFISNSLSLESLVE